MNKKLLKNISMILLFGSLFFMKNMSVFAEEVSKDIPNSLEKPTLPSIDFKKPENMPDININLSTEYDIIMKDLNGKGFGKVTLNLDKKDLDKEWSLQGNKEKLSSDEFKEYLNNVENKYLPQINVSKNASSEIKYDKIDLKGKWDLMSYEEAKSKSSNLPDYDTLKNNLKSSVSMPTLEKAQLSYSTPSEFDAIKNSVISNIGKKPTSNVSFGNLPSGITVNQNGGFIDNRTPSSLPGTIGGAAGDIISNLPDIFTGFKESVAEGTLGKWTKSKFSQSEKQKMIEEELENIR